jgi:hypothetical protein
MQNIGSTSVRPMLEFTGLKEQEERSPSRVPSITEALECRLIDATFGRSSPD